MECMIPTVEETAKFIIMVDKFFDTLNVTDINSGKKKKKVFQSPYRTVEAPPNNFSLVSESRARQNGY